MKTTFLSSRPQRGSALVAVIFFVMIMSLLTANVISYSVSERRSNERQRLILRARNMAENSALYASEQVTTKLYRLRSTTPIAFTSGSNKIYLPPDDVLTTKFSTTADTVVLGGLTSTSGLAFIDPADPANATNPNIGLQASTSLVPIIAQSTMSHPAVGAVTAYAKQDLQVSLIPLFQFAIFYNQDLEFSPGADMVISGPVHANGNLIARSQTGFNNTVQFRDRVTATKGFYANTAERGNTYNEYGSADSGPGGNGPLYFQNPAGSVTNIKSSGGTWRDHKYGSNNESATTLNQFKTFASATYGANLRTSVHGVTDLVLPGIDSANPASNNGRVLIDPPSAADNAAQRETKFARKAGLYIVVNASESDNDGVSDATDRGIRTAMLPDGSQVNMLPRSYRCWLNTVNADGSHTLTEVVLPGQPSYGYDDGGTPLDFTDDAMIQNDLPNRFTDKTEVGMNQVLRIPFSGRAEDDALQTFVAEILSIPVAKDNLDDNNLKPGYPTGTPVLTNSSTIIPDAYFYDLRRADNSEGYPFNRSSGNPFAPRPIAKIDFDMTRFRLAVERTMGGGNNSSAVYNPDLPNSSNWNNNILKSSATPKSMDINPNNGLLGLTGSEASDPFKIYYTNGTALTSANLVNTSVPSPWFDGITVYINSVDAESRALENDDADNNKEADTGVRLINGRGPVVSLTTAAYPGRTGLSLATNDALYIIGHFNADGSINSNKNSTSNPGGYSARYRDSTNEMLCSVMADAITILSQPEFTKSGSNYYQTSGWSDSHSGHRRSSSGWSSYWYRNNPGSSNRVDGVNRSFRPSLHPFLGTSHPGSGSNRSIKFSPNTTEISVCMLTGIVPTDSHQSSGGVHNYPRLLEDWGGTGLYIRGSMVAMFNSEVATEPWSIRIYTGAGRYWGLHQNLRDAAHDVPLEPVALNAQRLHYTELNETEYNAIKAQIEALPN